MNFLDIVMPPEWETTAELLTQEETGNITLLLVIIAAVAVVLLLSVFFAYRYRKGRKY